MLESTKAQYLKGNTIAEDHCTIFCLISITHSLNSPRVSEDLCCGEYDDGG